MKKETAFFEQFSTPQLEELLRSGLASLDDSYDEALLQIMEVLAQRDNVPYDKEFVDKAWEEFQTYYNIPEGKGLELYGPEPEEAAPTEETEANKQDKVVPIPSASTSRLRRITKVAMIAVATLAVTFGSVTVAQAAGYDFYGLMGRWTNDVFQFQISADAPTQEQRETSEKIQEQISAIGISENLAPTWWPERFELDNTIYEPVEDVVDPLTFEFRDREHNTSFGFFVNVYYDMDFLKSAVYEKDDTPPEEYVSHNRTFTILSNIDTYTAIWRDGNTVVVIAGQVTREELLSIIDSIGG